MGQVFDVIENVAGRFARGCGHRLKPVLRDEYAAFVADRLVVRRKGRREHEHGRAVMRDQAPLGHGLERTVRGLPEKLDRGVRRQFVLRVIDTLIGLRKLEPQGIGPAAEQEERAAMLGLVARLHVGVDDRWLVPASVDGELRRVGRADHELVVPRLRRHD